MKSNFALLREKIDAKRAAKAAKTAHRQPAIGRGNQMTKEQLIAILRDDMGGDYETAHGRADDALLEYIDDPEITEAFQSLTRWYA